MGRRPQLHAFVSMLANWSTYTRTNLGCQTEFGGHKQAMVKRGMPNNLVTCTVPMISMHLRQYQFTIFDEQAIVQIYFFLQAHA